MNIYRIIATHRLEGFDSIEIVSAEGESQALEVALNTGEDWLIGDIDMIGLANLKSAESLCLETL